MNYQRLYTFLFICINHTEFCACLFYAGDIKYREKGYEHPAGQETWKSVKRMKQKMIKKSGRDENTITENLKEGAAAGRLVHLDLLRILACFSVVMLHSSAQFWYDLPVQDADWLVANSYNAASRFGVPVFVMLSGALFLSPKKETDLKKLYLHNILRLVVLYIVWCVLYGLFDCFTFSWSQLSPRDVFREIFAGRYHLWYLPMLAGIYMLLPVLRSWISHARKENLQYFLLLFFIFQIGKETCLALRQSDGISFMWGVVKPDMVCGYLGYFVLGYYLVSFDIGKRLRRWIYAGGLIGIFANVALGNLLSLRRGIPAAAIYDSFGIFTFLTTIALFLFFTGRMSRIHYSPGAAAVIREVSLATLGVYLMHIGLIEFLKPVGIHSMMFTPVVCIPVFALFCFVVCSAVSAVLRRIPFVGRYLC